MTDQQRIGFIQYYHLFECPDFNDVSTYCLKKLDLNEQVAITLRWGDTSIWFWEEVLHAPINRGKSGS